MMVRRLQLTQHFTHRPPSGAVLSRICKDEESGTSPWPWQMPRSRQPWPSWRLPRDPSRQWREPWDRCNGACAGIAPGMARGRLRLQHALMR